MKQPEVLVIFKNNELESKISELLSEHYEIHCLFLCNIDRLGNILANNHIGVIVTIGETYQLFTKISDYGSQFNKKWIHIKENEINDIIIQKIMHCYMTNIIKSRLRNDLISLFTPSYNSKDMIFRPYQSLLNQTFKSWELIIVDDSDDEETYQILLQIANNDPRVKVFKYHRHSGYIGETKNFASKLCNGYAIVEFDHDDEITPDLLDKIHLTFQKYPEIGFIYSDYASVYDNGENFSYGEGHSFGYGTYINQIYDGVQGSPPSVWRMVALSPNINTRTITDIIGVPNHVRCWRKDVLQKIGFYESSLYVADDYDLLIKTFLETKMARIPHLGYFQYHNLKVGNFTYKRLDEIRKLQRHLFHFYQEKINEKFLSENLLEMMPRSKPWEQDYQWKEQYVNKIINDFTPKIAIVISTYNREKKLARAIDSVLKQDYQDYEIIIIGDKCPILDHFMENEKYKCPNIKWWNLTKNYNDGGATPKNYALRMCVHSSLIAYLDDDNYWEKDHLGSLVQLFENSEIDYAFSSMTMGDYKIKCEKPQLYRIDTSCIVHKKELLQQYGYWKKSSECGYANDWDLVSRWKNEKYGYSGLYTMIYDTETSLNNPQKIYEYYD